MVDGISKVLCIFILLCSALGCHTVQSLPPVDLSETGWTVRQGQAVWKNGESDLAGEIIFAAKPSGNSSLQFIKTPLPLVSAQVKGLQWTIHFAAEDRTISGKGTPPQQLIWLHLANALQGLSPPAPLRFKSEAAGNWELVNAKTSESISGFLTP